MATSTSNPEEGKRNVELDEVKSKINIYQEAIYSRYDKNVRDLWW